MFFRENRYVNADLFRCMSCAEGCETCVDSSPCMYERNNVLMIILILLTAVATVVIFGVALVIYLYRFETVSSS